MPGAKRNPPVLYVAAEATGAEAHLNHITGTAPRKAAGFNSAKTDKNDVFRQYFHEETYGFFTDNPYYQ